MKIKVYLASTNIDKIDAVKNAFKILGSEINLSLIKTNSSVNEQPIGQETVIGAMYRANQISNIENDYDYIIAIENGLFIENNLFVDKAVVVIISKNKTGFLIDFSDGVIFPTRYVELTSNTAGGFVHNTVGQIMMKEGFIKNNSDPHIELCGKSRKDFITETIVKMIKK